MLVVLTGSRPDTSEWNLILFSQPLVINSTAYISGGYCFQIFDYSAVESGALEGYILLPYLWLLSCWVRGPGRVDIVSTHFVISQGPWKGCVGLRSRFRVEDKATRIREMDVSSSVATVPHDFRPVTFLFVVIVDGCAYVSDMSSDVKPTERQVVPLWMCIVERIPRQGS